MSATTKKKEIIDFLWEWAENNGDWAKILVDKIATKEDELSSSERDLVFNHFLQSIGLHSGLPVVSVSKPSYSPTNKSIELQSLTDVSGVNRLAKGQTINFAKNLTVVYGENGTGKTGYGRILKILGYSYDTANKVLPNIFLPVQPQTATINFSVNSTVKKFIWDGTNDDTDLGNISVFNNNCVQISLSDRQLIVSPIGFHLFNIITSELHQLEDLCRAKIAKYNINLAWIETLHIGTPQQLLISGLTGKTLDIKVDDISTFNSTQEQTLKDKQQELSNLNKGFLQAEIQNLNSHADELKRINNKIETTSKILNKGAWEAINNLSIKIKELESQTQIGLQEIATKNGVEFYETSEFKSFIRAAEGYIKILEKPEYPKDGDNCVYCLQPLTKNANELLISYRKLLNDNTQEKLSELKKQKLNLVTTVKEFNLDITIHHPSFGLKDEKPIIPTEIQEYTQKIQKLRESYVLNKTSEAVFDLDYKNYIDFISKRQTLIETQLSAMKLTLANLAAKEIELKTEINELLDRKLLSTKVKEIKDTIANRKVIDLLNSKYNSFNTSSISRKTTEARDQLVQSNFDSQFQSELKAFRKSAIKVDLSFNTDKGKSKVSHRINRHHLTDILSEGEQKAIALAEFLTELQLDKINAPVVFDDPVNSLDHNIIDDVAKRLILLSGDRQVVIFTHSVLLFNSLLYFSKQPSYKNFAYKFYNCKNEFNETGCISEAEEEINQVKSYISKINQLINNTPKGRPEAEIAEDGYGYLRSAIELCVEHEIFQGTVKRYQKNVALTSFLKVKGDVLNVHKDKLNEIFERCCGYIKGHSNPTEIHNDPTVAELKVDFEAFEAIRKNFM